MIAITGLTTSVESVATDVLELPLPLGVVFELEFELELELVLVAIGLIFVIRRFLGTDFSVRDGGKSGGYNTAWNGRRRSRW